MDIGQELSESKPVRDGNEFLSMKQEAISSTSIGVRV